MRLDDEITDSTGVIELLDAMTGPLAHARAHLEDSLTLSLDLHAKSTASHRAGLREIAMSLMGISVLDSIANEVTNIVYVQLLTALTSHCNTASHSVTSSLLNLS